MNTLLWCQRDLRIQDNPALQWALQQGNPIVAIYIHSPDEDAPWSEGAASRWWLHNSLLKLSTSLLDINIKLHFFNNNSVDVIESLLKDNNFESMTWANRVEPQRRVCETKIENLAQKYNVEVKRFNNDLLKQPDNFLTASKQTPYKMFTPFYKKLRYELDAYATPLNKQIKAEASAVSEKISFNNDCSLPDLNLLDTIAWHNKLHRYWSPGETSALQQLDDFTNHTLQNYLKDRDYPHIEGTSRLSPHLHFGEISPAQILRQLIPYIHSMNGKNTTAAEGFLRQLIWREFARYILRHFPHTTNKPMNETFKNSFWKQNATNLKKWQQGQTGIAIVDAGMKHLWETGSMHNRVRMLVASLLTKNMGLAWQQGAHWFWDTLVDADLANNSMGWQWVAGCGVDAAPYFRIFNPDTQAKKFDPDKTYIQQWLGSSMSDREPMLDLQLSRKQALERYQSRVKK